MVETRKRSYTVGNPRGIPLGIHVLRIGEQVWYEGEGFDPPEDMPEARVQELVLKTFLLERVE